MYLMYNIKRNRLYSCDEKNLKTSSPMFTFKFILSVLYSIYTFSAFVIACCITPFLFFLYLTTQICRRMWFRWLEGKYKGLEFVKQMTVRTVVDTHRNQGIITVLLQVTGPCQINFVKNRIQGDIIDRTVSGKLVFAHLKTLLTSRWGCYAWVKGSDKKFNLNNHIIMANALFKGRPVSHANIQDYVTDIVSKLLPPEYPPWQITLIPSNASKSYLLIRIHHLYLSEDNLSLGDLLMLKEDNQWEGGSVDDNACFQQLMSGTFRNPMVIIRIYEHLCESLANYWNEYVSLYDPLENLSVMKKPPGLTMFCRLMLITLGSSTREYFKEGPKDLISILTKEAERRNVSARMFWKCFFNSIEPLNLLVSYIRWVWWCVGKAVRTPAMIIKIMKESPLVFYWLYLINFAVHELSYVLKMLYEAPRIILEEIFLPEHPCNVHRLQTLSLCGRKVVGWSEPVPSEVLLRISEVTGATTSEIALAAAASSLREYFDHAGFSPPDCVVTTSRFMTLEHLLARSIRPACGSLCLPLPTDSSQSDPIQSLRSLQESLKRSRSDQAILYLASLYKLDHNLFTSIFPTLFARACLYLLSRRYSVTLTQIDSMSTEVKKRQLLWGPEVEKLMYWRPPQANVCLSLTLMSYSGHVQLGVMADALLSPHHTHIASTFTSYFGQLCDALSIKNTVQKPLSSQQVDNQENISD